MATLQAPVANCPYIVNGTTYTSGQDGTFTVTDAGHIAMLKAIGILPAAPMPIGLAATASITCDMG